jgi:monoamine oxidase
VQGGGYTIFNGGKDAVFMGSSSIQNQVKFYLEKLDQIFPHTSDSYNGKAERFAWAGYGLTKGSYSAPLVGQWTEIFPHLAPPQDGIFFAGEHCSLEMQGFMEGAARSGRDAAKEMMRK